MNITKLRNELIADEGKVNKIYTDHLGYPTFGIGHLIKENDPEYGQPIGTPVSEERVITAFNMDICSVLNNCEKLYPDFYELPEEVQLIVANMMFNLGYNGLSKFRNMKKAIDAGNWTLAATEMKNSRWYTQVPNRAERLIKRMQSITA